MHNPLNRVDPWAVTLLALNVFFYVWLVTEIVSVGRIYRDIRQTTMHVGIDPSTAYYGGRSGWYFEPCCITLNRWR